MSEVRALLYDCPPLLLVRRLAVLAAHAKLLVCFADFVYGASDAVRARLASKVSATPRAGRSRAGAREH